MVGPVFSEKPQWPAKVPWPCTSFAISGFPLQAVNVGNCEKSTLVSFRDYVLSWRDYSMASKRCDNTVKRWTIILTFDTALREIRRLDIGPAGTYTTLCYIENECLNACGIDPKTNEMYCNQRPGDQQLVRVDCFLDVVELETRAQEGTLGGWVELFDSSLQYLDVLSIVYYSIWVYLASFGIHLNLVWDDVATDGPIKWVPCWLILVVTVVLSWGDYTPVEGKLCFFGGLPNMFQADFDLDGNYWCLAENSVSSWSRPHMEYHGIIFKGFQGYDFKTLLGRGQFLALRKKRCNNSTTDELSSHFECKPKSQGRQ